MKRFFSSKILFTGLRIAVGLIFIGASWYKIVSPGAFAHQIYNYRLLPVWAINPLAIVLPWLQCLAGVAVLIGFGIRGAAVCLSLMMLVFQGAVASALIRGLNISCGCFETGGAPATWLTFGRDSLIFILVLVCTWLILSRDRHGLQRSE